MNPVGDWAAIKADYVSDYTATTESLAAKYGLSVNTVRWHSKQDKWGQARAQHAETLAKNLTAAAMGKNVVHALKEINDRQLKQNDELRYMLNAKLKTRDLEGKISVRADVTIPDIAKAVAAFSELYRLDRLALGASTDNVMPATTADRLSAMTDDEIEAELERVRKRPLLN